MDKRKIISVSPRTEGMVNASASYYQESKLFFDVMNAKALAYDRIQEKLDDLDLQLSPLTATWGLIYWEQSVGLPMNRNEDYDKRRPPVLARLLNYENFSAKMVQQIAETYGNNVSVNINAADCLVTVTFLNDMPSNFINMKKDIERIIHAHLGLQFKVYYAKSIFCGAAHVITSHIVIETEELNNVVLQESIAVTHAMLHKIILTCEEVS